MIFVTGFAHRESVVDYQKEQQAMSNKILVTYATRYGSTQDVAETIAASLRDTGLTVDIRPIREVRTLEGFDAVVLGAALYMFRWHADARRFLSKHHKVLIQRPVAIFALGPISPDEQEMQNSREQLDNELAKYPWLTPIALEVFGGKIDPEKVSFPWKYFFRQVPASDQRNWDVIRTWANELPAKFAIADKTHA
jgi:menaquinone-dependent protoporphyrinogen oxidase